MRQDQGVITVRYDFRKRYRTELRTVFSREVRYSMEIWNFFRTYYSSDCLASFLQKIVFHSRSKRHEDFHATWKPDSEDFHAIWGNWQPTVTVAAEYQLSSGISYLGKIPYVPYRISVP